MQDGTWDADCPRSIAYRRCAVRIAASVLARSTSPSHLGFTDSRMLNALAQPDLEAAGYYAQKELLVQRR